MRLDRDGQQRLERAKAIVGSDLSMVVPATKSALHGIKDHARWVYLYNDISRRLREHVAGMQRRQRARATPHKRS
jgi:hypothetical protein